MHIFCTECGKHIDVSIEELENQEGHLVCPQCLAEIDVDVSLINGKAAALPESDDAAATTSQQPPSLPTPPALSSVPPPIATRQAQQPSVSPPPAQQPHIDDVMRYCKHCGAFLREGVNFCPKCGKYVRVSPPPNNTPPLTPAQQEAARLKANTPPARRVPQNKQSTYKPPQNPTYQATTVRQQRYNNSARNSRNSSSSNGSKPSKFSIMSLGGCLTATIVAVALFFIIYIIIGVYFE